MKDTTTIHNESVKMLAQVFHNIGVACLTAGLFVPIFAANLAESHPNLNYIVTAPFGIFLCVASVTLGQITLRFMRNP